MQEVLLKGGLRSELILILFECLLRKDRGEICRAQTKKMLNTKRIKDARKRSPPRSAACYQEGRQKNFGRGKKTIFWLGEEKET